MGGYYWGLLINGDWGLRNENPPRGRSEGGVVYRFWPNSFFRHARICLFSAQTFLCVWSLLPPARLPCPLLALLSMATHFESCFSIHSAPPPCGPGPAAPGSSPPSPRGPTRAPLPMRCLCTCVNECTGVGVGETRKPTTRHGGVSPHQMCLPKPERFQIGSPPLFATGCCCCESV